MTRLLSVAFALLLLGTLALPADAGGCGYASHSYGGYTYHDTSAYYWKWYSAGWYSGVYYSAGYYRVYYPAMYYPTYSVSYDGTADKLIKLAERQQDLIEKLALSQPTTAPETLPLKAAPLTDAVAILKTSCASCHAPAKAAELGGEETLFSDAGEPELSRSQKARAAKYISSTDPAKRCPKKGPLPAAELKVLKAWLTAAKD